MQLSDLTLKDEKGELYYEDICGECIGTGAHRKVYVFKYNPDWVVKVARESMGELMRSKGTPRNGKFSNRNEMDVWKIANEDFRKWFAPSIWLSKDASILLMQRGSSCDRRVSKLKWYRDRKAGNWVIINDRAVICDYGQKPILDYIKSQGYTSKILNKYL